MRAVTTITISAELDEEMSIMAKELKNSPALMKAAVEFVKKEVVNNFAQGGEEVKVTVEYID